MTRKLSWLKHSRLLICQDVYIQVPYCLSAHDSTCWSLMVSHDVSTACVSCFMVSQGVSWCLVVCQCVYQNSLSLVYTRLIPCFVSLNTIIYFLYRLVCSKWIAQINQTFNSGFLSRFEFIITGIYYPLAGCWGVRHDFCVVEMSPDAPGLTVRPRSQNDNEYGDTMRHQGTLWNHHHITSHHFVCIKRCSLFSILCTLHYVKLTNFN